MEQQSGAEDKKKPGAEMDPFTGDTRPADAAEKQLLRSTIELQDYIDNANVGLHWVDANGIIKWANKAELDMLGYSAEEYIGQPITRFHVHQEKIEDILARLRRNETLNQYESELRCKDGSIRTVHINSSVYAEGGEFIHTRCFTMDVTEQKRLFNENRALAASLEDKVKEQTRDLQLRTEELRKSQERYHKMVEEVEDYAIILLDRNGIVQNWNKGGEKIKGYKEEEIVGKSFQEFYLPEDREKGLPLQLLQEATNKGKAIHEGWRRRKDGNKFWGSIVLTALHDDKKNIIGFSKVTRDLTDKKITQDKMQEYLAQLEFQNRELEQFTYAASHDLKEPLRKIHLYNSFIAGNPNNQLDAKSKEYLERSIQATNKMKGLIEDLLAYSRLASDAEGYQDVNLDTLIEEVIADYKDETVDIEKDPLPVIRAVPFQIKQLLSNLISNAVKYRNPDRDLRVKIGCRAMEQYFQISVSDNGIGFDPQFKDKIFDIFQRLSNGARVNGSGIGLAICKRIVQNHKGFIEASGALDEGATFKVYLPKPH